MITLNSTIKGGQTMKKIISLILAAVMLLALGVSALATEIPPDGDMTVLQVTVRKHWYDNDEKAHHDDVLVDIYVDGKVAKTVTLSEKNNWEAVAELSVDPIPVGEKSNFIDNKVKIVERSIAGYKSEVYGPYEVGFYGNRGEIAYDITNSKMVRIEIPVSVTVKQTGNVAPSSHTFYYSLATRKNRPDMTSLDAATQSDSSSYEKKYKISYTGALTGDENGFSVTVDRKGTAKGTIVIEGDMNALYGLRGIISKRAQIAPDGWTYDESTYEFDLVEAELGDGKYETTYYMVKVTPNGSSEYIDLGKGTAAYVNEYKEDRTVTGSDTIKIPVKEENPKTGAPAFGICAAVIALGAAAVALKVRK